MEFHVKNKSDGGHTVIDTDMRLILGFTQANVDGKTFSAIRLIVGGHNHSEMLGRDFPNAAMALGAVLTAIGTPEVRKTVCVRPACWGKTIHPGHD